MESTIKRTAPAEIFGQDTLCLSCMKTNDVNEIFCRFCNTSLSLTSNPDPLQRLHGEGVVYRKAVEGKPKLVVLIGVWLIFAPVLILSLVLAISVILSGSGTDGFVMFWLMAITACFSFLMVYRVTRNYLTPQKEETRI